MGNVLCVGTPTAQWLLQTAQSVSDAVTPYLQPIVNGILRSSTISSTIVDFPNSGKSYVLPSKPFAEGGYALIYRAKDSTSGEVCAIKKVLVQTPEHLARVEHEVQVHGSLCPHPAILQLLDAVVEDAGGGSSSGSRGGGGPASSGGSRGALAGGAEATALLAADPTAELQQPRVVFIATPLFPDGALSDDIARLHAAGAALSAADVLYVAVQACGALQRMHSLGVSHRDIKPHNLLISRAAHASSSSPVSPRTLAGGGGGWGSGGGGYQRLAPAAAAAAPPVWAAQQPLPEQDAERGQGQGSPFLPRYQAAVVMDFGSAGPLTVHPATRLEALAVQEEAEAHSTATYRAPELFDVPTGAPLDMARCDVWALGCTLFHCMFGASPFQMVLDRNPGASLALAVLNASVPWPSKPGPEPYPQELKDLVASCLLPGPQERPSVDTLLQSALAMQRRLPMLLAAGGAGHGRAAAAAGAAGQGRGR